MDLLTGFIVAIFGLVLLVALAFTLMGLPGNWLMILAIAVMGLATKGTFLSLWQCISLVAILLLGEFIEFILPFLGIKKYKPSSWAYVASALGGILGGIVGTALVPLIGSFIGAAIGVFTLTYLVESFWARNLLQAQEIAWSAMMGSIIGMTIKFSLAVGIVLYLFVYGIFSFVTSL